MAIELGTILADFTTSLSAAMVVGATTGTLQSATDDDGVALPTGRYFFTLDGSNSSKEHISCTLTGTALTAIKSVSRQGVETSGVARAHRLGASVTLTDFAHILAINNVLVTGYASATTPTTDYQLATKKYADDISVAGATNATTTTQGLVELATQAEYDAGTATGGTGASLAATPAITRGKKYNDYAADSVGTDAYAITITPAITAYAAGQEFTFKAGTANTGACTLNVSALGAKTIKKNYDEDLVTGDIVANQIVKVVYDSSGNMQMVSNIASSAPVVRTYLNAGSPATWTKPTGLKYVVVECIGGGGGGGGADANTGEISAGAGGGAGAYSKKTIAVASLGATETVTTGAGGNGGSSTGGNGTTGGTSSFGSHCSSTGGEGGHGDDNSAVTHFAEGGTASNGDLNISGGIGQPANHGSTSSAKSEGSPGAGGASFFGGSSSVATTGPYGAGGRGAYSSGGGSDGGVGGNGIVIVTEYYS